MAGEYALNPLITFAAKHLPQDVADTVAQMVVLLQTKNETVRKDWAGIVDALQDALVNADGARRARLLKLDPRIALAYTNKMYERSMTAIRYCNYRINTVLKIPSIDRGITEDGHDQYMASVEEFKFLSDMYEKNAPGYVRGASRVVMGICREIEKAAGAPAEVMWSEMPIVRFIAAISGDQFVI